jgi:hypothetical protein
MNIARRTIPILCGLAVLVLAAGCRPPSERTAYRLACEALAEHKDVPPDAEPAGIDDAKFFIAKNAGHVVLPYRAPASGLSGRLTVRLKRVARTWTVERTRLGP